MATWLIQIALYAAYLAAALILSRFLWILVAALHDPMASTAPAVSRCVALLQSRSTASNAIQELTALLDDQAPYMRRKLASQIAYKLTRSSKAVRNLSIRVMEGSAEDSTLLASSACGPPSSLPTQADLNFLMFAMAIGMGESSAKLAKYYAQQLSYTTSVKDSKDACCVLLALARSDRAEDHKNARAAHNAGATRQLLRVIRQCQQEQSASSESAARQDLDSILTTAVFAYSALVQSSQNRSKDAASLGAFNVLAGLLTHDQTSDVVDATVCALHATLRMQVPLHKRPDQSQACIDGMVGVLTGRVACTAPAQPLLGSGSSSAAPPPVIQLAYCLERAVVNATPSNISVMTKRVAQALVRADAGAALVRAAKAAGATLDAVTVIPPIFLLSHMFILLEVEGSDDSKLRLADAVVGAGGIPVAQRIFKGAAAPAGTAQEVAIKLKAHSGAVLTFMARARDEYLAMIDQGVLWAVSGAVLELLADSERAMDAQAARSSACARCGSSDVALLSCSVCQRAYYCSTACQKADWQRHKPGCQR